MKAMTNTKVKPLAFILSVLMLVASLPISALASIANTVSDSTSSYPESEATFKEVVVLEEDEALRTENTKHFKLSDGTTKAVVYSQAVHYKDTDGNWVDIDNALTLNGSEYSSSNKSEIKFASKSGSNGLVSIKDGDYKIDFTPLNTNKVSVAIENPQSNNSRKFEDISTLNSLVSKAIYASIYDGIDIEYILVGNNIKENIIVNEKRASYAFSFELKLNKLTAELADGAIILSDYDSGEKIYEMPVPYMYDANNVYSQSVEYSLVQNSKWKYTLTVTADANWINSGERAFPVTIDPSLGVSDNSLIDYSTSPYEEVTVPETELWAGSGFASYIQLSSLPQLPNSAYIIDSTISLKHLSGSASSSSVTDGYIGVYESYGTYPTDYVRVIQNENGTYGQNGWYTWNIINIVRDWYDSSISSYNLVFDSVLGGLVKFYAEENGAETRPVLTISYRDMKGAESYWSYISQGAGNAGSGSINLATGNLIFEIGALPTTDSLFGFTPGLIYNSALAGLEYKYGYENAQIGYWGTYVANGFKANFNEALIKDSYINASGESEGYYIWADSDGTEHYFLKSYVDSETGLTYYKDEDGLQLTLSANDNDVTQDCIITDSGHNQRIFVHMSGTVSTEIEATWYLSKIRDVNGNELYFQIDGSKKPNDIKVIPNGSSAITMISPLYNSDSRLALLWNDSAKEGVVLRHSGNPTDETLSTTGGKYLREVIYIKCDSSISWINIMNDFLGDFDNQMEGVTVNAVMKYTYDQNGYLTVAHDTLSNYKIEYTYTNGKVTQITEYGKTEAEGQTVGIVYESGYTEVRTSGSNDKYGDSDDLINVYVFDNQGRAISSYSTNLNRTEIYGATSGEYVTDNKNAKNNIKISSVTNDTSANYLFNGNFELSDEELLIWESTGTVSFDVDNRNFGWSNSSVTLEVGKNESSSISQIVSLFPGEYSLYLNIITSETPNSDIILKISSVSDQSTVLTYQIASDKLTASGSSNFAFFTFEIPTDESNASTQAQYKVEIILQGNESLADEAKEDIKIDNVMLSRGNGVEAYNAIQNGSFDQASIEASSDIGEWNKYNSSTNASVVLKDENLTHDYALHIGPNIGRQNSVSQVIYQASDALKSKFLEDANSGIVTTITNPKKFIVSGFGKSSATASNITSIFALRLDITYLSTSESTETESKYFNFNTDSANWQYISGTYSIPVNNKLITEIKISCDYSNNIGEAYFDNISVLLEPIEAVQEYDYYEDGKLRTVTTDSNVVLYTYNENGDVLDVATRTDWTHYNYENADNPYIVSSTEYYTRLNYPPYELTDNVEIYDKLKASSDFKTKTTYTYNKYGLVTEATVEDSKTATDTDKLKSTSTFSYNIQSGSKIFGSISIATDSSGKTTRYYYNDKNGRLTSVAIDGGTGYYYTYDEIGNLIKVLPTSFASQKEAIEYEYTASNELEKIIAGDMEYIFTYDDFGNPSSIKIGSVAIVAQEINVNNGKISKVIYANGIEILYEYDKLERISKITYVDTSKAENNKIEYSYEYDSKGNVNKVADSKNNTTTIYNYDATGKLVKVVESDNTSKTNNLSVLYSYDTYSRLYRVSYNQDLSYGVNAVDIVSHSYGYTYNPDGTLMEMAVYFKSATKEYRIYYGYDSFGRCISKKLEMQDDTTITAKHEYYQAGENTTSIISMYETIIEKTDGTSQTDTYVYSYDYTFENIIEVKNGVDGDVLQSYEYDRLNRLVRANDSISGTTFVYEYDNNGNILSETEYLYTLEEDLSGIIPIYVLTYEYENPDWKDQLTSYNGGTITYDANGNPLTYWDGTVFTWENGTSLSSVQSILGTITYTYNSNGIRTSKTINGVKHTYTLEGSRIISEAYDDTVVVYLYDESNSPIGLAYKKGNADFEQYFFTKNAQGDIIKIYTENGELVAEYIYDTWGNIVKSDASDGYEYILNANCLLYRGYYFDFETHYYYLNARYYDPQTKRFISPDTQLSIEFGLIELNLYAYCLNNPVMYFDTHGKSVGEAVAGWYSTMWWMAGTDSISPIGDAIYVLGGVAVLFVTILLVDESSEDTPLNIPDSSQPDADGDKTDESNKPDSLPTEGNPNSHQDLYQDGKLKQRRYYGPDGRAERDIDYSHPGKDHKFPHEHKWDWDAPKPRLPGVPLD